MKTRTTLGSMVAAAAVLAACGSSSTSSSSSSGGSGPILIGGIFTLSGDNAASGQNFQDGAQSAINRINAHGGVLGRPLQLVSQDSTQTPTGAAAAARALVQDGVVAMIGDNFSADVTAEAVVANASHIPLLTSATANALFEAGANPYVFGVGENSSYTATIDSNYMVNIKKVLKPCVIEETGVFGASTTTATMAALSADGSQLATAPQQFAPGAVDVSVQLHALQSAGCDSLFVWAPSDPGIGAVARGMQTIGWTPPAATTQSAADAALVKAVGAPALAQFVGGPIPKAFLVADVNDSPPAPVQQYLDDFSKVWGSTNYAGHQLTAAYMYDAIGIISQAITDEKSTAGAGLKKDLESGKTFTGVRTTYTWSASKRIGESIAAVGVLQGGIPCVGPCQAAPGQ
jgi:branched-chain amino acid transport system substrate-binding protein